MWHSGEPPPLQATLQADLDSFKPVLSGVYRITSRDALATNAVPGVKESVSIRTNEWPALERLTHLPAYK
jgi:hypothetical protein